VNSERLAAPAARETIAVLGAGRMGASISRLLSAAHDVRTFDPRNHVAVAAVEDTAAIACETLREAVEGATLVVESAPENLQVKHELYAAVDAVNPNVLIASNTSSLLPSVLAEGLIAPERFLVTHYFNPADIVPLVELVPGPLTKPESLERWETILLALGKAPVRLTVERQGFVANRLQAALIREALALEREGVADATTIDRVMTAGIGPRWAAAGPFRSMDLGGLDIWTAVCDQLFPTLAEDRSAPANLRSKYETGRLGDKSGEGFFDHTHGLDQAIVKHIRRVYDAAGTT